MDKYTNSLSGNVGGGKLSNIARQFRSKIFACLMIGIFELRMLDPSSLTENEKVVVELKPADAYKLSKSLT